MRRVFLIIMLGILFVSGCSSYNASVKPATDMAKYKRVWVKTNMNDNHGLAQFICDALRARGIESDIGPLTMMPTNMQAILSYKDTWTWDFKDHMTGLTLSLEDVKVDFPIATSSYVGPASFTQEPYEVAGKLVTKLFTTAPAKPVKE